jgi:hypothetical protein
MSWYKIASDPTLGLDNESASPLAAALPSQATVPQKKPTKPVDPVPHYYKPHQASPLFKALWSCRHDMAKAAQEVYDQWKQDEDDELNGGGICHLIAEAISDVVSRATRYEATTINAACGENHVWCIAYSKKEAFDVDIPYHTYETGGGYTWQKIPDVVFDGDSISFSPNDPPGPEGYDNY